MRFVSSWEARSWNTLHTDCTIDAFLWRLAWAAVVSWDRRHLQSVLLVFCSLSSDTWWFELDVIVLRSWCRFHINHILAISTKLFAEWRSRDSAVGISTGYELDDKRGRSSSHGRVKNFLHVVQTGSMAHPASYPMGIWGSFPGDEATGAWSWPFTFN
jgi:hypothetical protein